MAYHPRSLKASSAAALALAMLAGCSSSPVNQATNPASTAAIDVQAPVQFSPFGIAEAPSLDVLFRCDRLGPRLRLLARKQD